MKTSRPRCCANQTQKADINADTGRFETSTQRPVPRGGRYRLCARVKERVERFPWFTDDGALLAEVELVEE